MPMHHRTISICMPTEREHSNYNDLGVLPPLGLWDPLGLAEDTAAFPRRRAVEIKAVAGVITFG